MGIPPPAASFSDAAWHQNDLAATGGKIDLSGIRWVIVGGESGPGARPMKKEWVIWIREHCREQRVPFFFKQWGGVRKAKNGRLLDGRAYDEYPERMRARVPDKTLCQKYAQDFLQSLRRRGRFDWVQLLT